MRMQADTPDVTTDNLGHIHHHADYCKAKDGHIMLHQLGMLRSKADHSTPLTRLPIHVNAGKLTHHATPKLGIMHMM